MRQEPEAKAWAEKVIDGLIEKEDLHGAWYARATLLRLLDDVAADVARRHRQALIDLDDMLRAFYEVGGFEGLLRFLLSSPQATGAFR